MPRPYWKTPASPAEYEADLQRRKALLQKMKNRKLTQTELISRMQYHGIRTSRSELSGVFHGTRHGRKVDAMLDLISRILEDYDHA